MEKGDYLEVHFEESEDLQSPIFIPAELISKLRTKRQNMYIDCSVSYDPELFSKKISETLSNTFLKMLSTYIQGMGTFLESTIQNYPPHPKTMLVYNQSTMIVYLILENLKKTMKMGT